MYVGEATALDLRLRERLVQDAPPIGAFCGPADTRLAGLADDDVGVMSSGTDSGRDETLLLVFQHPQYGIPSVTSRPSFPDFSSWSLRPTTFGTLATMAVERREPRSSRAWLIAACAPFCWPFTAAAAPAPSEPPAIQRPKDEHGQPDTGTTTKSSAPTPPELPKASDPSVGPEETSGEASPPSTSTAATEPADGSPKETPPPRAASTAPPQPNARSRPASPFDVDPQVVDAAWEGVVGLLVDIELKGGIQRLGRVTAVQEETFTLIESPTGRILVMSKASVDAVRVRMTPPLPARNGIGLLAGGSVLLTVGVPTFISGAVLVGLCPSCIELHLPLLMIGSAVMAGGIPMLIYGTRQRRIYHKALEQYQLVPAIAWTRNEWTGGLRLRF